MYNRVNQLNISIYPLSLKPPSPSSRTSQSFKLGSLCYTGASHSYLFYTWQCIYVNSALPSGPTRPFPPCIHKAILYIYIKMSLFMTLCATFFSFNFTEI